MKRLSLSTAALVAVLALCATNVYAQTTILSDDFSSATTATTSPNWTVTFVDISGTSVGAMGEWRFDNPQGLVPNPPFSAPFAMADSDLAGSGTFYSTYLISNAFDASTAPAVLLDVDWVFNDVDGGETFALEAFDGAMWNVVNVFAENDANTGALTPSSDTFDLTTGLGASDAGQIRFAYENANWAWHAAVDNVHIYEPPPYDLACTGISAPFIDPQGCVHTLTATETVTVDLLNNGGVVLGAGEVYRVFIDFDSVNVLTEQVSVAASVPGGTGFSYSTMGTVDMSATGTHDLTARVALLSQFDSDTSNDEFTLNYTSPAAAIQGFGYSENFDSLGGLGAPFNNTPMPAGWDNAQDDAASLGTHGSPDWGSIIGGLGNGPAGDHTSGTGTYVGIEDSTFGSGPGDIELRSPCLDTSGAVGTPTVSFWNASDEDLAQYPTLAITLNVDIIDVTNGGVVTTSFLAVDGDGSDIAPVTAGNDAAWRKIDIDVSSFAPSIIKVQFRVNNDNGSGGFYDDEALDDFLFFDSVPAIGQPPRPGMSVFDINGSVSSLGNPVSSGNNGPYVTQIVAGTSMAMSWEGAANYPVSCFYGNANPQSATFPGGIGQTDVGGPALDINGYPVGIGVFADGIGFAGSPASFGLDAFFFCDAAGAGGILLPFPSFGLPAGSVLTTFQCTMATPTAPFFFLSNAVTVITD